MAAQGDIEIVGVADEGGKLDSDGQGGEAEPGTPVWAQDFESYANDTALLGIDSIIDTSGVISTTQAYSGTKSVKHMMEEGSDCAQSYGFAKEVPFNLVQGDEFWVQGWFYYPVGFAFGNDGNAGLGGAAPRSKFFRLLISDSEDASIGYNDVYLWEEDSETTKWTFIFEGEGAWAFTDLDGWAPDRPSAPETDIPRGEWHKIEMYIKLHSVAGQAIVRLWENDLLKFEIDDLRTLNNATDYASLFRFCTYYNGGAPATQHMFTDDWKFYTSESPPTNTDADDNIFIGDE